MGSVDYYNKAEIYLTICTHPDFDYLRYVGLDTKCDPNYMGSSVTLKWFINKVGRSYFKKEILEVCSGTMRELCRVEQKHIFSHDAVKDPNYLNMNGIINKSLQEDAVINMEYILRPSQPLSQNFVAHIVSMLKGSMKFFDYRKQQLARRIVSMVCYGYLKYDQTTFEYSKYSHYGSCSEKDLQDILQAMANKGILDSDFNLIEITEFFISEIPPYLEYEEFVINNT